MPEMVREMDNSKQFGAGDRVAAFRARQGAASTSFSILTTRGITLGKYPWNHTGEIPVESHWESTR